MVRREAVGDQIVQNLSAKSAPRPVGAEDRHAARLEEGLHRRSRRVLRAFGRLFDEAGGRLSPIVTCTTPPSSRVVTEYPQAR